jgi:hypothetical protein
MRENAEKRTRQYAQCIIFNILTFVQALKRTASDCYSSQENPGGIIKSDRDPGSLFVELHDAPICPLIFLFIVHISVFVIGMSPFRIRSESGTPVCSPERARTRGASKHGPSATKPSKNS